MFSKNINKSVWEKYPLLLTIPKDKFPNHICIIPDGNGRYAKSLHRFTLEGHKKGANVLKKIIRELSEIQYIHAITIWGFSSDNWKREDKEIQGLMKILEKGVVDVISEIKKTNGKFIHLGRKDRIPQSLLKIIEKAEDESKLCKGQILALAIDFGGEDQEMRLLQKARELPVLEKISLQTLWDLRDGKGLIKSADLLIRTANEKRTSDIGWLNGAPTEFFVIKKLFPEITMEDIVSAILDFSNRERRMGGREVT